MAVLTTAVGTFGTLAGVVIGFLLNSRATQRRYEMQARREVVQAREAAYVELLAAHRHFRRFILTSSGEFRLVEVAEGSQPTPVMDGAASLWEALETAAARVQIIAAEAIPKVGEASARMRATMYELARARAKAVAAGSVPREPIWAAREAEEDFVQAAQADLVRLGIL